MSADNILSELTATAQRLGFTLTPEALNLLGMTLDRSDLSTADDRADALRVARSHLMRAALSATSRGVKEIDLRAMALALADAVGAVRDDRGEEISSVTRS
jgi:hypothetical protein